MLKMLKMLKMFKMFKMFKMLKMLMMLHLLQGYVIVLHTKDLIWEGRKGANDETVEKQLPTRPT